MKTAKMMAVVAVLVVGMMFGLGGAAQAGLMGPGGIVCPTGPHPTLGRDWAAGDTYHLVFCTSTFTQATSTDIAYYNTFVNDVADGSSLTGVPDVTWYAVGSTPTTHARDNALVSAPVYRLDLALVADGFGDLWDGAIAAAINVDENGVGGIEMHVWSGSTGLGYTYGPPTYTARALGDAGPHYGAVHLTDGRWNGGWFNKPNTESLSLYSLSDPLTITAAVPVPEPAGLGLIGLALLAIRKRRA